MFISLLRILTKAVVPETTKGLRVSTAIYFISSSLVCGVCLGLQLYVLPNLPIVKYYKGRAVDINKGEIFF